MSNIREAMPVEAEEIAEMVDRGESVNHFFTGNGRMVYPIDTQSVNVEFSLPMLQELDRAAGELNVSRQAVIKSLIRQSLDQHYLATAHQPR